LPLTLPLDTRTLRLLRDYLQHGRAGDTGASPMLFLRARCPYIPLERSAVGGLFRKRVLEGGLPDFAKHVSGLRHTFAMRLLAAALAQLLPEGLQAPVPAPEVDTETPFAVGDIGWMNGTGRGTTPVFDAHAVARIRRVRGGAGRDQCCNERDFAKHRRRSLAIMFTPILALT
jgi:hypothetical protein